MLNYWRGVIREPDNDAEGGGSQEAPKAEEALSASDFKALQDELASLKKQNQELSTSERYWAEKAKGSTTPKPQEDKPDFLAEALGSLSDEDDDSPDSFVDELTSKGLGALTKRGVITKKDLQAILEAQREALKTEFEEIAEGRVSRATKQLESDNELLRHFPEFGKVDKQGNILDDDPGVKSFLESAQRHYQRILQRSPGRESDPSALFDAGEMARMELGKSDSERMKRINAQSGGGGGPEGNGDGELTDRQKSIIQGMGITAEEYQKRAKSGIQLKGMPMHGAVQQ